MRDVTQLFEHFILVFGIIRTEAQHQKLFAVNFCEFNKKKVIETYLYFLSLYIYKIHIISSIMPLLYIY